MVFIPYRILDKFGDAAIRMIPCTYNFCIK